MDGWDYTRTTYFSLTYKSLFDFSPMNLLHAGTNYTNGVIINGACLPFLLLLIWYFRLSFLLHSFFLRASGKLPFLSLFYSLILVQHWFSSPALSPAILLCCFISFLWSLLPFFSLASLKVRLTRGALPLIPSASSSLQFFPSLLIIFPRSILPPQLFSSVFSTNTSHSSLHIPLSLHELHSLAIFFHRHLLWVFFCHPFYSS